MTTVGVRRLKAQLSAYLRQVKAGQTVVVTDRGEVVAELRPPERAGRGGARPTRRWEEAVAAGLLLLAERPDDRSWLDGVSPGLASGSAAELLDAERAEG